MLDRERSDSNRFLPVWVRHEHLARYDFAARFVEGKIVLDCACGDGTSSVQFADAGAARVHAVDKSDASIANAARRFQGRNIRFAAGDATRIPLEDRSIDVYVSLETIEHIDADTAYLREATRLLQDDGVFICSTPNRIVTNPGKSLESRPFNAFHVREYSEDDFVRLLARFFEESELFGQNPTNRFKVRLMGALGRILPCHGAARINQLLKLPRLLFDKPRHHRVIRLNGQCAEYLVAVCRKPRRDLS